MLDKGDTGFKGAECHVRAQAHRICSKAIQPHSRAHCCAQVTKILLLTNPGCFVYIREAPSGR